jgi:MFS transporter, UMF1 family
MTAASAISYPSDLREYKRRIRAWTLYDWANSAFATTILAAVLPIYYSQVAGATLPSEAVATSYWSLGLSISLIIAAIISPILGTVSDVTRGKKRFLAIFAGIGILGTAALVFIGTGDWLIASIIAIVGRVGFTGANTFYDALLPHVAREEDQDSVSTRGYAMGYLGGGLLLAINVVMIFQLGFEAGARLSFVSVAIWWAVFSIPIFRQVPEPASATEKLEPGETVISASFARIWATIKDIRRYRELFKFLIAFLIYNDAIGTIIGVAAIYGAELGFGSTELILALLLVQFVGIPFSLIFGRLPSADNGRRPVFLAFIVFNVVALPLVGILGARILPQDVTGVLLPPYETVGDSVGTGVYIAGDSALKLTGNWENEVIPAAQLGMDQDALYVVSSEPNAELNFPFHGEGVNVMYSTGPDHGIWNVLLDGQPLMEAGEDGTGIPVTIDAYSLTDRYGLIETFEAEAPGTHTLSLVNTSAKNEASSGTVIAVSQIEVLAPVSLSSLPIIIGMIFAVQLLGLVFAYTIGQRIFENLARQLNTKSSIILALVIYSVIAIWGYFINSTIEFWFLAWMVAIVQGGSQALSRSLYAAMSPASKSGEFFGLFGVMEKFSAFIGPLIFAFAAVTFGNSRPAILALIAFFIVGGYLLTRVNVEEGRRVAQEEDAAILGGT